MFMAFQRTTNCGFSKYFQWLPALLICGSLLGCAEDKQKIIAEKVGEVNAKVEEVTGLDYDRFCRFLRL